MKYFGASDDLLEQHGIKKITHFDSARVALSPLARLEAVRQSSQKFRDYMLCLNEQVKFYKSIDLVRVPYPTKYGFLNVETAKSPYLHILNRLFIVQFVNKEGLKTLLFSPSDVDANAQTPFFKNLRSSLGKLEKPLMHILSPRLNEVESALEQVGLRPQDIDYISYDHLHTQDIRKWLGTHNKPGYFPNAKLLVMTQEWVSTCELLPPQRTWYCPNGLDGIDPQKVILLDSSVMLADSVALVKTPGHTEGNHSLVAHTPDGLFVTSENGISADCYAPQYSEIKGVRDYAQNQGMDVVLNGNTLEGALDQYLSMVMEKTIAGPSKRNPNFPNVATSSEFTAFWCFPGLRPTFTVGELEYGSVSCS